MKNLAFSPYFKGGYEKNGNFLSIWIQFNTDQFVTSQYPGLANTVLKELPEIVNCLCFNTSKQPFYKEIHKTELGHLFEHVLLEYMHQINTDGAFEYKLFTGETEWNWQDNPRGLFNISVNVGDLPSRIVEAALKRTVNLINTAFGDGPKYIVRNT